MALITPQSPLWYRDYRLFWIARFASVIATSAIVVVVAWQVYDIARSDYGMSPKAAAFQLGLVGLAQFLPLLLLTPVAGWVADRFERRLVARLATALDMLVALALGAFTAADALTLPLLFTMAALHGTARVFVAPAISAIGPNVVPREVIPRAIAMSSISWQGASVVGPALGGLLYAGNAALPYWYAAFALAVANLALNFIKPVAPPDIKGVAHPIEQMIDGLRYVRREHFLLGAITLDLFAVLLGGATALLPVYARDILHVGPAGLGVLRGAPALGALVVALWFSFRPLRHNVGVKMLWSVVVFGVATIGFGVSAFMPLAIAVPFALMMLGLLGAADMFSVYIRSSLVQLRTPDTMRGRVGSVSTLAISASNELGEMQSGVAAALLGPVGAVLFGGVGAIAVTALWSRLFPELKNARSFESQAKEHAS